MKTILNRDYCGFSWDTTSDLQLFIEKLQKLKTRWENDEDGMNHLNQLVWVKGRDIDGL